MVTQDAPSRIDETHVPVKVWDLPVRAAHWALVALMGLSWLTAEYRWIEWHKVSGYAILTLVLFRVYWAFAGSTTARLSHFLRGPAAVLRFAGSLFGRTYSPSVGHNPLGGWNVLALLSLLLLQAGLGLFAVDEFGIKSGPLASYVTFETGRRIAGLHESVFDILLVLVGLHVVAVLAHLVFKRENLITPMLTGVKRVAHGHAQPLKSAPLWQALLALAASALFVACVAGAV